MPRNYAAGCHGVQTINSKITDQHSRWCGKSPSSPVNNRRKQGIYLGAMPALPAAGHYQCLSPRLGRE
jgi:hypothetical protein